MNLRRGAAIALGRTAGTLSRHLGGGGGSALPGLLAARLDPQILEHLASQLPQGSLLVTGTNGKTTTARMAAAILRAGGLTPLQNRTGSNLLRGLTAALLEGATLSGHLRAEGGTLGVFEVDEAVLPLAAPKLRPRAVAITNLFRDQLDRYGEVDTVRALWAEAIARLPTSTTLVLNADDPAVASLGQVTLGPVLYFGVEDGALGAQSPEEAADSLRCHRCGSPYSYCLYFYAHLGHFQCPACGAARPSPQVAAREVQFRGFAGTSFRLTTPQGDRPVSLALSGLYNVYNALAAAALGLSLGQPLPLIAEALEGFSTAFGRMERVSIQGRQAFLILVKNPTGFNQVLRTLSLEPGPKNLLLVLNDQIADGRDISWVWDVDFQHLQGQLGTVLVSGLRAEEMALRLKYAGFAIAPDYVEQDLARALDRMLGATPLGGALYILPTYTAMLSLQRLLARRGWLKPYWEKG